MKSKIILLFLSIISLSIKLHADESITIVAPGSYIVCNDTEYEYTVDFSGLDPNIEYGVDWDPSDNGSVEQTVNTGNPYTSSTATIKWDATTEAQGYIGTITVKLLDEDEEEVASASFDEFTIKSIKHLKPEVSPGWGGQLFLDPCDFGNENYEATELRVPGTGDVNPEIVYLFDWVIPEGWSIGGHTSNGSEAIQGPEIVTVTYPASVTEGTIKVRGRHVVQGCTAEVQLSKWSDPVTIKRKPNLTLATTTGKNWLFCGDTDPVTFVLTPHLSCAKYYWNGSPTPSNDNTFTYTPYGDTNFTIHVSVLYGTGPAIPKSLTIEYKVTDPDHMPYISGSYSVCDNMDESYKVENVPNNYNVNWQCSGNLILKSSTGTTAVFEKNGTGEGGIKAKIETDCGDYPSHPARFMEKQVYLGLPGSGLDPDVIYGPDCCEIGSTRNFFDGLPMPLKIDGAEWYT